MVDVKMFLAGGIHVAAYNNQQADITRMLDKNKKLLDARSKEESITPLMCAIMGGHDDLVEWFISLGCKSIDYSTDDGLTAMHFAAKFGRQRVVQMLCRAGATTINAMDMRGCTPLHLSLMSLHIATARYIMRAEPASIETRTYCGYLPVHIAAEHGDGMGLKYLVQASPCLMDDNNNITVETPLHVAARLGHSKCVRILLHAGSEAAKLQDILGFRPLIYALRTKNALLIGMLVVGNDTDYDLLVNVSKLPHEDYIVY